jgi:hypothetical protein
MIRAEERFVGNLIKLLNKHVKQPVDPAFI